MIEKDDWRLLIPRDYLMDAEMYEIAFLPLSGQWDHEHCEFCGAKFSLNGEDLKRGYCTAPGNTESAHWICVGCFEDFRELFGWKQKRRTEPGEICP